MGGPIEAILQNHLAGSARNDGVSREIVCIDDGEEPFLDRMPLRVHALGKGRMPPGVMGLLAKRFGYSSTLLRWLRSNVRRYDAIIVDGLWNYTSHAASRVLPKSGVLYYLFPHGMMDRWFSKSNPLKHMAKQVLWLFFEGSLAARARAVLYTASEEKVASSKTFLGHSFKGVVVGLGTSPPPQRTAAMDAEFQAAVPGVDGKRFLLFFGRLHPKKGCDILVSAFARAVAEGLDYELVMAGPDQLGWSAELQRNAELAGVSHRIHWCGPLYGGAKWGALYGADAFVLPSHQENFGIAVAEALGCGTPVLISNKVNIWREILEAGAGLCDDDTEEGAMNLLHSWSRLSPPERTRMSFAAAAVFKSAFDVNRTSLALENLIRMDVASTSKVLDGQPS